MTKRALITGITGQDGSYLAELLLAKGYDVHGIIRRSSSFNTARIEHMYHDPHEPGVALQLHYGDLSDSSRLSNLIMQLRPDEIYNLGAQSHVAVSFEMPEFTADVTAMGTLRLLEALRHADWDLRFYQAGSSEMFGKVLEVPQKETTPFYPRSPYAVAKVFAHQMTIQYREAYDLFACNGILFNHECLGPNSPLVVRHSGTVNVVIPSELMPLRRKGRIQQSFTPLDLEIWDGVCWARVKAITATRHRPSDPDHRLLLIQARGGIAEVTAHHHMIDSEGTELPANDVSPGNHLAMAPSFPTPPQWTTLSTEFAEFLGLLTAEGHVSPEGRVQFTNCDQKLCARVTELWSKLFLGTVTRRVNPSGWEGGRSVEQLYLNGARLAGKWLKEQLYTDTGMKRVPPLVLNAGTEPHSAYLNGYYAGDGLKAGNGDSVKTNSAVLAQGLCWLYSNQGRSCSVYAERRGERTYYQLNLATEHPLGQKGQHLRKPATEVRTVANAAMTDEWVFDIETESGRLCAGVGRLIVHNSPRRGATFVTRKVTRGVAAILAGRAKKLYLGNLTSMRDWGYAPEFVEAMWLMLQQEQPGDYVVATGEMHSVLDLVELAFGLVGLDWRDYVQIDERYFRPTEVDQLLGDPRKAKETLGWEATTTFRDLIRIMLAADINALGIATSTYPEIAGVTPDVTSSPLLAALAREDAAA